MRRLAFLVLVFTVSWTPNAFACNEPSLGSVTARAEAGDPVSFSVVNLDPGASYSLLLAGRTVASAGGATVSGTFVMPDLGRAGTYFLELHVAHDGGTWVSSRAIQFLVSGPPPAPAAKPYAAAAPKSAAASKPKAKVAAAAPAVGSAPVARPVQAAPQARSASEPKKPAAQRPAAGAKPAPVVTAPALVPREAPVAVARPQATEWNPLPWFLLPAGGLLLIGASVLAVARHRQRTREALIEAELQAMIAEARAEERTRLRLL